VHPCTSFVKDWAVFACKDDTLYRVPKAHNRATTHFLLRPLFIQQGTPRSTLQSTQLIFLGLTGCFLAGRHKIHSWQCCI